MSRDIEERIELQDSTEDHIDLLRFAGIEVCFQLWRYRNNAMALYLDLKQADEQKDLGFPELSHVERWIDQSIGRAPHAKLTYQLPGKPRKQDPI